MKSVAGQLSSSARLATDQVSPFRKSAVTNGTRLHAKPFKDGAWSRRFADVLHQIISDMGGPDGLSEGQRQLARRAATLSMECERLELQAVSGKSLLEQTPRGGGPTPLQILEEAAKVLHALARMQFGDGGQIVALAAKPREEQDRVADLLTRAADIAAKAHLAGGQVIDLELYGTLCDRLNRVFVRLGLERKARDVSPALPDYLDAVEVEAENEAAVP